MSVSKKQAEVLELMEQGRTFSQAYRAALGAFLLRMVESGFVTVTPTRPMQFVEIRKITGRQWQASTPQGEVSPVLRTKRAALDWLLDHTCDSFEAWLPEGYADMCRNYGGHITTHIEETP